VFEPEEKQYIDPPPRRKDILEDPIYKALKRWLFQLRKREVKVVEIKAKD